MMYQKHLPPYNRSGFGDARYPQPCNNGYSGRGVLSQQEWECDQKGTYMAFQIAKQTLVAFGIGNRGTGLR